MVSDGLTMINSTMSSTSFKLGKVRIGVSNYLGNNIWYPASGRTGENCLLATKVMIPIDGPVRENTGLLGSPCFEIPRMVERDKKVEIDDKTRKECIRAKTIHNVTTMFIVLGCYWGMSFMFLLSGYIALLNFRTYGVLSIFAFSIFILLFGILWFALFERASLGFGRLTPKVVSMYDPYFWTHERHWKLAPAAMTMLFKGTPFKNWISRLLGVRVGKKVFDDGCYFCEKTMIEIGDYTNLNDRSVIQGHSLEEGLFKSDAIKIGTGCTIGGAAFVHYGVTMGDNVVLEPNAFLMKGEILDAGTSWRGNPAKAYA
jgi:non-ribosomal peptide synthetase-like protein